MPFLVAADAAAAAASRFLEAVVPTVVARVSTLAPFDDPHVCAVRRSLHRVRRVCAGLSCLVSRVSAWFDSVARALSVCVPGVCLSSVPRECMVRHYIGPRGWVLGCLV